MKHILSVIFCFSVLFTLQSCKDEPPETKYNTTNYQVDGWSSGSSSVFQAGFKSGERAGVTLGPINETFIINEVKFLFGGATDTKDLILRIYWDEGTVKPGEKMYEGTHSVSGNDASLQVIALRDKNITFHSGGSFRVTLEFKHDGLPCIARDDDGSFTKTRNWVYTNSNWVGSDLVGLKDDFVIRASVDTKQ